MLSRLEYAQLLRVALIVHLLGLIEHLLVSALCSHDQSVTIVAQRRAMPVDAYRTTVRGQLLWDPRVLLVL